MSEKCSLCDGSGYIGSRTILGASGEDQRAPNRCWACNPRRRRPVTAKPTDTAGEGHGPLEYRPSWQVPETLASTKDLEPSSPSADKGDV